MLDYNNTISDIEFMSGMSVDGVACTQIGIVSDLEVEMEESLEIELQSDSVVMAVEPNVSTVLISTFNRLKLIILLP